MRAWRHHRGPARRARWLRRGAGRGSVAKRSRPSNSLRRRSFLVVATGVPSMRRGPKGEDPRLADTRQLASSLAEEIESEATSPDTMGNVSARLSSPSVSDLKEPAVMPVRSKAHRRALRRPPGSRPRGGTSQLRAVNRTHSPLRTPRLTRGSRSVTSDDASGPAFRRRAGTVVALRGRRISPTGTAIRCHTSWQIREGSNSCLR